MAIVHCFKCDEFVDDDWNPCVDWKGELICPDCAETYTCLGCEAPVDDGDLDEDGNCVTCAYESRQDAEEAHADDLYTRKKEEELFKEYENE